MNYPNTSRVNVLTNTDRGQIIKIFLRDSRGTLFKTEESLSKGSGNGRRSLAAR